MGSKSVMLLWIVGCSQLSGQLVRGDLPEHNCHLPVGVANLGLIPYYWLYASDGNAFRGRLHQSAAWRTNKALYKAGGSRYFKDVAWLQVDLKRPTLISGIQTQGDPIDQSWVTYFSVYISDDCEIFSPLKDVNGVIARFHGNFDSNTSVTNLFHDVSLARCVRVVPLLRAGNYTSLRIEILGCDVRVCREAIINHLEEEINILNRTTGNDTNDNNSDEISDVLFDPSDNYVFTKPTITTRGYVEFKFPAEQMVFGSVFYIEPNEGADKRFIVTYSRNCHNWEPIREKKRFGDPKIFRGYESPYRTRWYTFPYPVRAHCVRIIPITNQYKSQATPIKAHFIGCGVIHACGLRKEVPTRVKRVVGGEPSAAGQWPWLVSLTIQDRDTGEWNHICGGTMVHPKWVLTAAHCLFVMYSIVTGNVTADYATWNEPDFRESIRVRIGEHSLKLEEGTHLIAKIQEIVTHDLYNVSYYLNDIAMLKLEKPIRLTDHASLVCLSHSQGQFNNESHCQVAGWGRTHTGFPSRPHTAPLPLIENSHCQRLYSHLTITPDMICAGPSDGSADACVGDSGGPLVCEENGQWYQVGITSWNIGCGKPGYPGVYARVPHFINWIDDVISERAALPTPIAEGRNSTV